MFLLTKRKQPELLIFLITCLLIVNLIITTPHNTGSSVDSLQSPVLLATQYQFDILNVQQASKVTIDKLSRADSVVRLTLPRVEHIIQRNQFAVYERVHLSRLFIILQRLLLPKENTSKFKSLPLQA